MAPTTPIGFSASLREDFQSAGDFDGGTATSGTFRLSPQIQNLNKQTALQLGFDSTVFASQAALDAAFPLDAYFFTATNSTKQTSQSADLLFQRGRATVGDPRHDCGTGTLSMNTTAALTLNFNAFTPNPNGGSSQTTLQFTSPNDPQSPHQFTTSNTSTSFLVPANTLLAGTAYTLSLTFAGMNSVTVSTVNTVVSSGVATQMSFVTAAASGAAVIAR